MSRLHAAQNQACSKTLPNPILRVRVRAESATTAMPRTPRQAAAAPPADPARRPAAPPVLVDGRRGRRQGPGSGGRPAAAAAPLAATTRPPQRRAAAAATPARAYGSGEDARGEGTVAGSTWTYSTNSKIPETLRTYSRAQPLDVFLIEFSLGCFICSKRADHFELYLGLDDGEHMVLHFSTFVGTYSLRFEAGRDASLISGCVPRGVWHVFRC